jgi:hypothetical protein
MLLFLLNLLYHKKQTNMRSEKNNNEIERIKKQIAKTKEKVEQQQKSLEKLINIAFEKAYERELQQTIKYCYHTAKHVFEKSGILRRIVITHRSPLLMTLQIQTFEPSLKISTIPVTLNFDETTSFSNLRKLQMKHISLRNSFSGFTSVKKSKLKELF